MKLSATQRRTNYNRRAWRPFTDALNKEGFKRTYSSDAGGQSFAEYQRRIGNRTVNLQLWGNGKHRVSHIQHEIIEGTNGIEGANETTTPTNFTTVEAMKIAIKYEFCRDSVPGNRCRQKGGTCACVSPKLECRNN